MNTNHPSNAEGIAGTGRRVTIGDFISVPDLAEALSIKAGDVVRTLFKAGIMATINQQLDHREAALAAEAYGFSVQRTAPSEPSRSDSEILFAIVEAERQGAEAARTVHALESTVDFAFASDDQTSQYREATRQLRDARALRRELVQGIDLGALRARVEAGRTPTVEVGQAFDQQMHAAAADSSWMPAEYVANDWQADVLAFLRDGMPAAITGDASGFQLHGYNDRSLDFNGCHGQAILALDYIAKHGRPADGGEQFPNAACLVQIASELRRSWSAIEAMHRAVTRSPASAEDPTGVAAQRFEDMSRRGRLSLQPQEDGDMVVWLVSERGETASVEFCSSGGQSPHTLQALRFLSRAMNADQSERPQNRGV